MEQISLGICYCCNKKQIEICKGGYWSVNPFSNHNEIIWYCLKCEHKRIPFIVICEKCGTKEIQKHQGTYTCNRCKEI